MIQLRVNLFLLFYGTALVLGRIDSRRPVHLEAIGVRLVRAADGAASCSFGCHELAHFSCILMQISLTLRLTFCGTMRQLRIIFLNLVQLFSVLPIRLRLRVRSLHYALLEINYRLVQVHDQLVNRVVEYDSWS